MSSNPQLNSFKTRFQVAVILKFFNVTTDGAKYYTDP
jgi:hypothetical protein